MIHHGSRVGDEIERAVERARWQDGLDAAGLALALWFVVCVYAWCAR